MRGVVLCLLMLPGCASSPVPEDFTRAILSADADGMCELLTSVSGDKNRSKQLLADFVRLSVAEQLPLRPLECTVSYFGNLVAPVADELPIEHMPEVRFLCELLVLNCMPEFEGEPCFHAWFKLDYLIAVRRGKGLPEALEQIEDALLDGTSGLVKAAARLVAETDALHEQRQLLKTAVERDVDVIRASITSHRQETWHSIAAGDYPGVLERARWYAQLWPEGPAIAAAQEAVDYLNAASQRR